MEQLKEQAAELITRISDEGAAEWLLDLTVQQVYNDLCTRCHTDTLPKQMETAAVKVMVGEYLKAAQGCGLLRLNADEGQVTSISMGDTSYSYDVSQSKAVKFAALIEDFCAAAEPLIPVCRKLVLL